MKGTWGIQTLTYCGPQRYRVVRIKAVDETSRESIAAFEHGEFKGIPDQDLEIAGAFATYEEAAQELYKRQQEEKMHPWVVNYLARNMDLFDGTSGASGHVTLVYARNISAAAKEAVYAAMKLSVTTADSIFITDIGIGEESNAGLYGCAPLDPLADDYWPE
jgi:hypothetical protein